MSDTTEGLAELRAEIDRIDDEIATLVVERIETAETVAEVKADAERDLVDTDREAVVQSHYERVFEDEGLDGERGRELAAFLIETALRQERAVTGSD